MERAKQRLRGGAVLPKTAHEYLKELRVPRVGDSLAEGATGAAAAGVHGGGDGGARGWPGQGGAFGCAARV